MGFILLYLFFPLCSSSLISFKYDDKGGYPYASFYFKNVELSYGTSLSTYLPFSVFDDWFYGNMQLYDRIKRSLNLSKIYECRGIKIDIEIKDNVTIKEFSSFISTEHISFKEVGISFALHFYNLEYSVVHQLYANKYINKLQFSFEENPNKEGGMFHIGQLSEETQKKINSMYKGVIKVRTELPTWGFTLNHIIYDTHQYDISIPCIIITNAKEFFYSDVLYDIMKSIFLSSPFECSDKYLKKKDYWVIYCYDLKEKNTTIDFAFETMSVSFPITLLFDDNGYSLFRRNSDINNYYTNYTGMIIGDSFIKSFNLSLFDYANSQISFYSSLYKITVLSSYKDTKNFIQSLYIYIQFMLCINIIIYIIILNSKIEMRIHY